MTVKELKDVLQNLDDNLNVHIQDDPQDVHTKLVTTVKLYKHDDSVLYQQDKRPVASVINRLLLS
jgi:hypothetical protein